MVKKCKLKKKHFCKEILRQHSPFLKKKTLEVVPTNIHYRNHTDNDSA